MKNILWIPVILILAALLVIESRYSLVINSPIVAKIDRFTGDVWIANSGLWIKVKHSAKETCVMPPSAISPKPAADSMTQVTVK